MDEKPKQTREAIKAEIAGIRDELDHKVLHRALFEREAKLYFLQPENKNKSDHIKFNEVLSQNLENGKSMEFIDGDLD